VDEEVGVNGTGAAVGVVLGLLALGGVAVAFVTWSAYRHRELGTPAERATFSTLHTASLAAPPLREGLTPTGARRSARHLRTLLGTPAIALTDVSALLAWDGETALGPTRVSSWDDDFVSTYKVSNYQLAPGVSCP